MSRTGFHNPVPAHNGSKPEEAMLRISLERMISLTNPEKDRV
jgi:hypothetical protein